MICFHAGMDLLVSLAAHGHKLNFLAEEVKVGL